MTALLTDDPYANSTSPSDDFPIDLEATRPSWAHRFEPISRDQWGRVRFGAWLSEWELPGGRWVEFTQTVTLRGTKAGGGWRRDGEVAVSMVLGGRLAEDDLVAHLAQEVSR